MDDAAADGGRRHVIHFRVRAPTRPWEHVYVCGDAAELGEWRPANGLALTKDADDDGVWLGSASVPAAVRQVDYRYFKCQFLNAGKDTGDDMVVVLWEVNLRPRSRLPNLEPAGGRGGTARHIEEFATYGGKTLSDDGWLMGQTEVRLRLHGEPIQFWKRRHAQRKYRIRVTPVDLRYREMGPPFDAGGAHHLADEEDSRDAGQAPQPALPSHTRTLLAVLNDATDSSFGDQAPTGRVFHTKKDFFVYKTQSVAVEFLGFLVDFFVDPRDQIESGNGDCEDRKADTGEPAAAAERVAFSYVLPGGAADTYGCRTVPITSMRHQPIGQISVDYLLIKPVLQAVEPYRMDVSYARHWKKRQPLNVGHRGLGSSYTKFSIVRENTVHSLQTAGEHGADYVEFDVQLTRDRVPIVFHDFHVNITISRRRNNGTNGNKGSSDGGLSDTSNFSDDDERNLHLHKLSLKDLKLKQLRLLQVTHASSEPSDESAGAPPPQQPVTLPVPDPTDMLCEEGRQRSAAAGQRMGGKKWDLSDPQHDDDDDHQPFPTLQQVLGRVNTEVGFNVEIKYPMLQTDGTWECEHFWERNEYLDAILADVLNYAGERRIVFSSFDPDICNMLKLKQNRYPVQFLSMGRSTRYMPFLDERSSTTTLAVRFVKGVKLLGINFHSEDLLRDPTPLHLARQLNLVCFIWGDDLDNKETQRYFRDLGLDAIIYDRINEGKNLGHRNVFMIEKQVKDALFRSRSRSPATMRHLDAAVAAVQQRYARCNEWPNHNEWDRSIGGATAADRCRTTAAVRQNTAHERRQCDIEASCETGPSSPEEQLNGGKQQQQPAAVPKVVVATPATSN